MAGGRQGTPRTVAGRVLAILGSFSREHAELSLVEISRRAGLAMSTTHRLVGELQEWGALERDAHLRYRIGSRLRELAALPPDAGQPPDDAAGQRLALTRREDGAVGSIRRRRPGEVTAAPEAPGKQAQLGGRS